jgi:hypothetical protein
MELTQTEVKNHLTVLSKYIYMCRQPIDYKRADMFKSLDVICEYLLQKKAIDIIHEADKYVKIASY